VESEEEGAVTDASLKHWIICRSIKIRFVLLRRTVAFKDRYQTAEEAQSAFVYSGYSPERYALVPVFEGGEGIEFE
jgi:hypothetical protein